MYGSELNKLTTEQFLKNGAIATVETASGKEYVGILLKANTRQSNCLLLCEIDGVRSYVSITNLVAIKQEVDAEVVELQDEA